MIVKIIGAGFAGVEASFFLANKGIKVELFEMRDKKMTPAHQTGLFAELICSNSFKAISIENAHGLLKKELEELDSFAIKTAYKSNIPAGGALAVDRGKFSSLITNEIKSHPNISIFCEEIESLDDFIINNDMVIIATGPLTSDKLLLSISNIIGDKSMFFFDASAPIISGESINFEKVFFQSRYNKGTPDYLNAPFNKEEYLNFVNEIKKAEKLEFNDFEDAKTFEGCLPIEVLAGRGDDTLSFGPMKPVGLIDPKTNNQPFAVVQMRAENISKSMYNMVGFQTRMKWKEQDRIFRMIPGLENAEFLRYGVMHRNSYLNLPKIINKENYSLRINKNIYFAGQITGVEGYIESAASGLFTAYSLWADINNKEIYFPENTISGALQKYSITENKNYQPMPSNFGLLNQEIFNEKGKRIKGRDKKKKLAEIALRSIKDFKEKFLGKLFLAKAQRTQRN